MQRRALSIVDSLAPLAGSLEDRQAGTALAAALSSLAAQEDRLAPAAQILQGLVAVSSDAVSYSFYRSHGSQEKK